MSSREKQYLIFLKYTREYLSQVTGYSKGTLSRIASGARAPSEVFIGVCCHALKEPQEDLFRFIEVTSRAPAHPQTLTQDLLETIAELAARLTEAEKKIKALQDELHS